MTHEYSLTLNDYVTILRRRAWLMVLIFFAVLSIALAGAIALKPIYQSTGTILVESQIVSPELIQGSPGGYVDEQIEVIRQRVLTRENLLKIIEKHQLYKEGDESLTVSEKIELMRAQVMLEPVRATAKGKKNAVTIAFQLSFEGRSPEIAHGVANDLVTLFLNENVRSRTERAGEATDFLTHEADRIKKELDTYESQIAEYKQRHGNALPQHLELTMTMLSRAESELQQVERDRRLADDELKALEAEQKAVNSEGLASGTNLDAAGADALKAEYTRLSSLYKESHPDLRALKRRIAALESSADGGSSTANYSPVSIAQQKTSVKLNVVRQRINDLGEQQRVLRGRIQAHERQISQTPQVERALSILMRDYDNAQKKYAEIRAKQMSAQVTENMVQENKAERFTLIEPPTRPDKPAKPDRVKIILLGFFASFGVPIGLVFVLENINQRIRGANALAAALGHRPLVVIPYITTREQVAARQRRLRYAIIIGVVVLGLAVGVIHKFYMPLDLLMFKIAGRFS
ncbi:MAG TPA: Wzz/FepE/Etk N-terminal domain-containing protein [Pyrinomonadaceae bacterium]|nr:Wzz/FepE/Etk N-terminal domain-containing protein [Pyrinomonadaceae bacterium]